MALSLKVRFHTSFLVGINMDDEFKTGMTNAVFCKMGTQFLPDTWDFLWGQPEKTLHLETFDKHNPYKTMTMERNRLLCNKMSFVLLKMCCSSIPLYFSCKSFLWQRELLELLI